MSNVYSRLSDMSIEDDVLRVELYKKVLNYIESTANIDDIILYEVKEDEQHRPDLLAYRVFGNDDLRWLVMLVAGIDDDFEAIPAGYDLAFPPLAIVRTMIREVRDNATS
ncbi:baseplate wedge protein 53 (plasmid) [Moritella sp. 24]|uniref:baseplate wedge protein 53 n=1 Tax=Moritella sp. 24 TaxID=2746230 RepID=UPI001BA5CB2B|nr:baseplate wedge protein 53 [Moritella sp. 24]QUM78777.1 baseplate wedge protein 53 [Moritella sp. 24]